jgi:pimeloyl-ACP methyl ester carboxylesterase
MRRPAVLALVVVVLVGVLTAGVGAGVLVSLSRGGAQPSASATARSTWPAPAAIRWGACDDDSLAASGAECAVVAVPLDWSAPRDGRTVRIAISRVEHTASPYAGVMLANPGGPGASGIGLATLGASVPDGVGARYDWIGFDPRGVGASRPRVTCDADYADGPRPAYEPGSEADEQAWLDRTEAYATACGEKNAALLPHMTTRDSANDMEYLRIALGVDRISFYGFSYGTYLGQVYATLYPGRLARMVLDSTVDPTRVWYGGNLDQDVAFQVAIDRWFAWLARYDRVYGLGGTADEVEATYDRLSARLAAAPANGVYGSAELTDTMLYAGYSQGYWSALGEAFARAVQGDTGLARSYWRALNDTGDDNEYAAYLAVQCTDQAWPSDWATWRTDAKRIDAQAPFETWGNTWYNAPCRTWPAAASTPVRIDGTKAPPILMIDETLDAATPYSGSVTVRGLFPKARLLALPDGTSHADSLSGNPCVDDAIAGYLDDGDLPARAAGDGPDLTCSPGPEPTP